MHSSVWTRVEQRLSVPESNPVQAQLLEEIASEVASAAAHLVRAEVGRATKIRTKSTPTDVLTATDLKVEEFIRDQLTHKSPGSMVLGEEFGTVEGDGDIGWIVDPVDGTVNLLYGLPVVSVSIAATFRGKVVAGAVADVLAEEVFAASKGGGAHVDGSGIKVNDVTDLSESLLGIGFSYSASQRRIEADVLTTVLPNVRDIRCMGSAALNLAWVACGRLDAYCESEVEPWDVAAGALIVSEAGGTVDISAPTSTGSVIAAPPGIVDSLRRLLDDSAA